MAHFQLASLKWLLMDRACIVLLQITHTFLRSTYHSPARAYQRRPHTGSSCVLGCWCEGRRWSDSFPLGVQPCPDSQACGISNNHKRQITAQIDRHFEVFISKYIPGDYAWFVTITFVFHTCSHNKYNITLANTIKANMGGNTNLDPLCKRYHKGKLC